MATDELQNDPLIGRILGADFEIRGVIGRGGMGVVYEGFQPSTERSCAIKIIPPQQTSSQSRQRFLREGRALSRLNHPNIVTVYRCGETDDSMLYIAMERIEGGSLRELLSQTNTLSLDRALPLMIQITEAIAYAHSEGILHRDIKPANILVRRVLDREFATVLDFGLAKFLEEGAAQETVTSSMVGSPPYMAPEQWEQMSDIDARADVYSLGCLFYRMLTGVHAFRAQNMVEYMRLHMDSVPFDPIEVQPRLASCRPVSDVLRACISRERESRFPSAAHLLRALRALEHGLQTGHEPVLELPEVILCEWTPLPAETMDSNFETLPSDLGSPISGFPAPPVAAATKPPPTAAPNRSTRTLWAVACLAITAMVTWQLLAGDSGEAKPTPQAELGANAPSPTGTPAGPQNTKEKSAIAPAASPTPAKAPTPGAAPQGNPPHDAAKASVAPEEKETAESETPPTPPVAPTAGERTLLLTSKPPGATVYRDKEKLGTTPLEVTVTAQQELSLRLQHKGYRQLTRTWSWDQLENHPPGEAIHISLRRKAPPTPPVKKPKPTPKPSKLKLDSLTIE